MLHVSSCQHTRSTLGVDLARSCQGCCCITTQAERINLIDIKASIDHCFHLFHVSLLARCEILHAGSCEFYTVFLHNNFGSFAHLLTLSAEALISIAPTTIKN